MSETRRMPVMPLKESVLFPGLSAPVAAGREKTVAAIEAALASDRRLFAVAQREEAQDPRPHELHTIGVIVQIQRIQRSPKHIELVVLGEERAQAVHYQFEDGCLWADVAEVREFPPLDPRDIAFEAMFKELRERAIELGGKRGLSKELLQRFLESVIEPGQLADLIAPHLELKAPELQDLLETLSVEERMRRVLVHVQRQIELLNAQAEIHSQVEENIGQRQREVYLREQLKAIQKQLGDEGQEGEVAELRKKLEALALPEEARSEVARELRRLERIGNDSMEAQVIRSYLEWIAELPWSERSPDNLDLVEVERVLEEDHFGLKDVKDRVLEFLAVRQLRASKAASVDLLPGPEKADQAKARAMARGPILLFIGPPGVGKSSIAKSIARSLRRKFVRVSLGGVRDEADIRGHRRTYVGSMPGRIIQGMRRAGVKNPVFLLDEVDKLSASFQGNPASALLEVLDPVQNDAFSDHYLNVPFDLSEVLFVATANFVQGIPAPLLDRMEVVEFSGYTEAEKTEIARRYLIPRQMEESALTAEELALEPDALQALVSQYTRESGVRQLERQIGSIARKLARKLAAGETIEPRVTQALVRKLLGHPKVRPERANQKDEVGVATGMYYSPTGGDIMFVEASVRRLYSERQPNERSGEVAVSGPAGCGPVSLILTGQLGEVMQESARAALTYATAHATELGVPVDHLGSLEVHVHVPAGAIPKDGPSAGVAMATAIVSALTRQPVRSDLAMTGEITLRGRVLPIGGLKEKILGAHRAGIREILLPAQNEDDLEEIPADVRAQLTFRFVASLGEVIEAAIRTTDRVSANAA